MMGQMKIFVTCSLSSEICRGHKNEICCTHARTNCHNHNRADAMRPQHIREMHCWGPNLFWHGCNESQIFGPQTID